MVDIRPESKIIFHDIRFSAHPDDHGFYSAARWDTDVNLSLNRESLDLIRLLSQGVTIAAACRTLKLDQSNGISIVRLLLTSGFIKKIGREFIPDQQKPIKPWLPNLKRRYFTWLLKPELLLVSFLFIAGAVFFVLLNPGYLPAYTDFFWTPDLFVVAVTTTVIGWLTLYIHELAHFFATKAVGGESVVRFSNRFIFLVAETEHYHLWVIPKVYRYFVYFAGMFIDMLIIAVIIWTFKICEILGIPLGTWANLLSVIILIEITGIVWEFSVYLETDIYNFLSDYFDQDNLYSDTKHFLNIHLSGLRRGILKPFTSPLLNLFLRPGKSETLNDQRTFTRRQKNIFLTYSLFFIVGLVLTSLVYLFYTLPKDILFIYRSLDLLRISIYRNNFLDIFKSTATFILSVFPLIMLIKILTTKIIHRESIT